MPLISPVLSLKPALRFVHPDIFRVRFGYEHSIINKEGIINRPNEICCRSASEQLSSFEGE